MTDLIDERLSRAAQLWQDTLPPAPTVAVDRLVEPAPRRSGAVRVGLAAAAAVAVVAAGAVVAGQLGSRSGSATPTGTPTHRVGGDHPATVPWAALPATHPHLRTYPHGDHTRTWSTPYDRVSAVGAITGKAAPGDVIVFDAVLESSTDLPLAPCPDYNIAFGTHSFRTWQLNCSAVPFHDAQGRPYLPAFTNVRFEMQVTVPDDPGRQKVLWTLDGPRQLPGFYGIVDVVRP
jgi:hypothetical protein